MPLMLYLIIGGAIELGLTGNVGSEDTNTSMFYLNELITKLRLNLVNYCQTKLVINYWATSSYFSIHLLR